MESAAPETMFGLIIETLLRGVARRAGERVFLLICRGYPGTGPFTIRLCTRLGRTASRFASLVRRLRREAARPFAPRHAPRRPNLSSAPHPTPNPDAPPLPRNRAWLGIRIFEARVCAAQLDHLLRRPATQTLIASDYRFGRILRPLCHMLGLRNPPIPHYQQAEPEPEPSAFAPAATPFAPAPANPASANPAPAGRTLLPCPHHQRAPPRAA